MQCIPFQDNSLYVTFLERNLSAHSGRVKERENLFLNALAQWHGCTDEGQATPIQPHSQTAALGAKFQHECCRQQNIQIIVTHTTHIPE